MGEIISKVSQNTVIVLRGKKTFSSSGPLWGPESSQFAAPERC